MSQKVDDEEALLDSMLAAHARGALPAEKWDELFASARRGDRLSELAFAFESVSQGKRLKALPAAAGAEFLHRAAHFFGEVFGDELGEKAYLERAIALAPHAPALRRAAEIYERGGAEEQAIETLQRLLRIEPADADVRAKLKTLLLKNNRLRDVVRLDEQALTSEPPPDAETKEKLLVQIVRMYEGKLHELERAAPHVEQLLAIDPMHEEARRVAQRLLSVKGVAGRVAAALASAYETFGTPQEIARVLAIELENARSGPKRANVLARLAAIKQDRMGDAEGAFEALEQALAIDPGDAGLRERYVALAYRLSRYVPAYKTLSRAAAAAKDPAAKAGANAQLGEMLLRGGDTKRAKATLGGVLSSAQAAPETVLAAARALREIVDKEKDPRAQCEVLERIARASPDEDERREADERVAELAAALKDTKRAIAAYERLLATSARAKALAALEPLYEASGDPASLARLLEERARDEKNAAKAREHLMRAAQARAQDTRDDAAAAIATCRALVDRFGPARDVLALLVPLLEAHKDWAPLAEALALDASLAPAPESARILARLGAVKMQRLRDAGGAIESFRRAIAIEAREKTARSALEKLLAGGDHRLAAAVALEPVYRREKANDALVEVLALRGELASDLDDRLAALREAVALADASRAPELAGRALVHAVEGARPLGEWIDRVAAAADPGKRAALLGRAIGEREVTSDDSSLLAQRAAEAHAEAGEVSRAIALYRRALLGRAPDAPRRKELCHRIGALERNDLGDAQAAIATYRAAIDLDARDADAHAALCDLYAQTGALDALCARLEAWLRHAQGDAARTARVRLAAVAADRGDVRTAGAQCRLLLDDADSKAEHLEAVETVAVRLDDAALARAALRRRIDSAHGAREQVGWLDKLGTLEATWARDAVAAAQAWRRGAELAESEGDDDAARSLYRRALEAAPGDSETVCRLAAQCERAGRWDELAAFEPAIDAALARGDVDSDPRVRLSLARARTIAADPRRADDAAMAYRAVLEDSALDPARRDAAAAAFEALVARDTASPARLADRRWLREWRSARAPDDQRVPRLLEWARDEETAFADAERALDLYKRVIAIDGDCEEALAASARLALAAGDAEGALSALRSLRDRTEGAVARVAIELQIADVCLAHARTREAIALLERACDAADDAGARGRILGRLVETPSDAAQPEARGHWFESLCDLQRDAGDVESALATAVRGARETPAAGALWDRAEDLARSAGRADEVAAAYEDVLARRASGGDSLAIAERAVAFHEEWFDEPSRVVRILQRVLDVDPRAEWAFDRLELLFDAAERWDDLFALYDRALESAGDAKRVELLRDAAQTAKDFADRPERAIDYLERLLELTPDDATIASALERLYERQGRHRQLVDLLSARLPSLGREDAMRTRARIAALWLGGLGDPKQALDVIETMLQAAEGVRGASGEVWPLLERILASSPPSPSTPPLESKRSRKSPHPPAAATTRHRAAALLRDHYAAAGSDADLARVLSVQLETIDRPEDRAALLLRIASLHDNNGDLAAALDAIAAAVTIDPTDRARRAKLVALAESTGRLDTLADVLGRVLADPRIAGEEALAVARKMDALLEATGRAEERLEVVARIAASTADATERRDALARAANLATSLGRTARAIEAWEERLAIDARDADALDGLADLFDREGRFDRLVGVLEARARTASDPERRRADRVRAAKLLGDALGKSKEAIAAWCDVEREFGESDESTLALAGLLRRSDRWEQLAKVLERGAKRTSGEALRAELWTQLGDVHRDRLGAPAVAMATYVRALSVDPSHAGARDGLLATRGADGEREAMIEAAEIVERRAGDRAWAFEAMRRAFAKAPGDGRVASELARLAEASGAWSGLVAAYREAIEGAARDDAALVAKLRMLAGEVLETRTRDARGALDAYLHVVRDRVDADAARAAIRVAGAIGEWDAAEAALRSALERDAENAALLAQLVDLQRRTKGRPLVESLVRLSRATGGDPAVLREAAEVACSAIGDRALARGILSDLLAMGRARWESADVDAPITMGSPCDPAPHTEWAIESLAKLHEEDGDVRALADLLVAGSSMPFDVRLRRSFLARAARVTSRGRELLALREKQMALADDAVERSDLRLDAARLGAELGADARELHDALCERAQIAQDAGEHARAADLWSEAAVLAEESLGDADRASACHTCAVSNEPRVSSLRTLARLASARGDHGSAARWLERLLEVVDDGARAECVRALAGELRAAGETADVARWSKLARVLGDAASAAPDKQARLACLREAAGVHLDRCSDPASAVPLLEQACDLAPDDHAARLALADALARAKRFDDARAILRSMVDAFGGRRPKERAPVHREMARLELAMGNRARALVELDTAARVDPQNPQVLKMLAELARDDGQLDRAEKSYRALLVVLRRDRSTMARSEVLLELSAIALRRNEPERAREILESAIETAADDDVEHEKLEAALRARGDRDSLARVLEARLARLGDPPAAGDVQRACSLLVRLGGAAESAGDARRAASLYERAVRLGMRTPDLLYPVAALRLASKDTIDEGIEMMRAALEADARLDRAESALRAAVAIAPEHRELLDLYEHVGRHPGHERALVEALERRAQLPGADIEVTREAVQVAMRIGDGALAESLLDRFVEGEGTASQNAANLAWAIAALAELREASGDLPKAVELKRSAARIADPEIARRLQFEIARLAADKIGDLLLAAETYEALHGADPAAREAWEPLAQVYRRMGDARKLCDLLGRVVDFVDDAGERCRLRLERVRAATGSLGMSDGEAAPLLREIVDEDPSQVEAALVLAGILERGGKGTDLAELLSRQIDAAKDRGDAASVASLSLRLGALLERGDRVQARNVYYAGLDWDAKSRDLLDALLRLLDAEGDAAERADVFERRVEIERGPSAEAMALELHAVRERLGDAAGAQRALEIGCAGHPASRRLRERLEGAYRERCDWNKLADLLTTAIDAAAAGDATDAGKAEREDLFARRASVRCAAGDDAGALEDLEAAFASNREYARLLAQQLERCRAAAEAKGSDAARALKLRTAQVLPCAGDVDAARAILMELVRADPKDRAALRTLASLETSIERWDAASAALRRLVGIEEGDAMRECAIRLADACQRAGRPGDARGALERARSVALRDPDLRERLERVYEETGAWQQLADLALEDARSTGDVEARFQSLLRAGSLLLERASDPARAATALEEARALRPGDTRCVALLADALTLSGRAPEALALLEQAMAPHKGKRIKEHAPLHWRLARVARYMGDAASELRWLVTGFEADPQNGEVCADVALRAIELDQVDVAERALRAITLLKTPGPMSRALANQYLGDIARKKGDPKRALALLKRALAEDPSLEAARAIIASIERGA